MGCSSTFTRNNRIEADKQSRALEDATELKFNPALFRKIEKFGKSDIYHFATRINKQLDRCVLASGNQRQWL